MNSTKPWFWPDTQGFLAVAIITLIAVIVLIMLMHPIQMDDRSQGVLMTVIGVLVGSLKDVYSYFFGSSRGSAAKDDTIKAAVESMPPAPTSPSIPRALVGALLAALALSFLLLPIDPASAQGRARDPLKQLGDKIKSDIDGAKQAAATNTTNDPGVSCDFRIFLGLTPDNLQSTIKKCLSDVNSTLADDTARALESAQAFKPNPDQDAVNCLTPGLALLRAGVQVPAVAATDTTPAAPAKEPGLILLFQKYREFVLAGALTSCKTWVDTPLNATGTQVLNNAGAVGAAALLLPK